MFCNIVCIIAQLVNVKPQRVLKYFPSLLSLHVCKIKVRREIACNKSHLLQYPRYLRILHNTFCNYLGRRNPCSILENAKELRLVEH